MAHPLAVAFAERLKSGLKRHSLTSPSRWACAHRMMGKPFPGLWSFDHHPWLREMHDSRAVNNVGQKAAQVGYTETVLNITFYKIDIERVDCLYVLPAKNPDASDFSASRFDPALEMSPYLMEMFSEVKNVGHKRAGSTNLYIRGSKSRSGLKSIPAGFIVLDEVDEMDQDNIPLAMERASGQPDRQSWKISTPTIDDTGINKFYNDSTQEHFMFKCPHCSKIIELTFPESLIITASDLNDPDIQKSHLICTQCKGVLLHEKKVEFLSTGRWEMTNPGPDTRGFYINQLYSPAIQPAVIAETYLKSLVDIAAEQEFFNSKLGLPHVVAGAQINEKEIQACMSGDRKKLTGRDLTGNKIITMGVDVGRWLHVEIDEWDIPGNALMSDVNTYARPRVIWQGKVQDFSRLDDFMQNYSIHFAVVDANPERRLAYSFACRFWGRVKICFYGKSANGKQLVPATDIEQSVVVDRTSWLDSSLGRFHRGKAGIELPMDIDFEYKEHLKAQVRIYAKDRDGNPVGKYITPHNKADHYAHARNYAEIALPFALGVGEMQNTGSPL
jgi:hypothetical protein